jgi:diguanylate cyclase (GGDEF)-like protein
MTLDYFLFYSEANIVCIVILAILLMNDKLHSTKQEKQIWFNRTIVAHILYFLSDIGWAAVLSGNLPRTRFLVVLFNFLNYILLSLIAYEWFMYMAASEKMKFRESRKKRMLCLAPMLLSVAAVVIVYIVAPQALINENNELGSWYYPMMIAVPVFYLLAAFVFSMINAGKAQSKDKKRLFRLIGIYPLGLIVFGLIQTCAFNAPLFCFGCAIMLLFFYIQNMQTLVSVDSLTRLNNRGQIDRFMEQTRFKENVTVSAMMMDIDHFKQINDTWGHAEGDKALILVSDTLKQAAERMESQVFIGRCGGDEFIVFIQSTSAGEGPVQMAEAIRAALREKQAENKLPYELNVSIGWDVLQEKNDSLEACLARADQKLYEIKRARR